MGRGGDGRHGPRPRPSPRPAAGPPRPRPRRVRSRDVLAFVVPRPLSFLPRPRPCAPAPPVRPGPYGRHAPGSRRATSTGPLPRSGPAAEAGALPARGHQRPRRPSQPPVAPAFAAASTPSARRLSPPPPLTLREYGGPEAGPPLVGPRSGGTLPTTLPQRGEESPDKTETVGVGRCRLPDPRLGPGPAAPRTPRTERRPGAFKREPSPRPGDRQGSRSGVPLPSPSTSRVAGVGWRAPQVAVASPKRFCPHEDLRSAKLFLRHWWFVWWDMDCHLVKQGCKRSAQIHRQLGTGTESPVPGAATPRSPVPGGGPTRAAPLSGVGGGSRRGHVRPRRALYEPRAGTVRPEKLLNHSLTFTENSEGS